MNKQNDATVSDILMIMAQLESEGLGHYVVTRNSEYTLAKKNDRPEINHNAKTVDLGGYDG
ncbi:hypothetical protein [Sedimenticola selenatireducens]|uniref:Uncharacterized protein n=1 Tax=Sedimenticola selenatireducens TaxID=191960 RepID=A0A557SCG0_9GAMM|nr:hypothetical protein [Sedimenticola selenatireducens]TVO75108.1 hypothetical protein FHP88_08835 [Sedimenticola selenatireducens]TVT67037.1 MAG: hypothetical protein FHK78_01520 [Sedimenticola selenatireducens]